MGRGIISGVIWGSVVAVMSLWVASQLGDMINVLRAPPANVEAQTPEVGDVDTETAVDEPVAPTPEAAPATDPSRQGLALATGKTDGLPNVASDPASVPKVIVPSDVLAKPETGVAPDVARANKDAAPSSSETAALTAPEQDRAPQAVLRPAAPAVDAPVEVEQNTPEVPQGGSGAAPAAEQSPEIAGDTVQPIAPMKAPEKMPEPVVDFSKPQVVETPLPVEPEPAPEPEVAPEQPVVTETETETAAASQPVPELADVTVDTGIGTLPDTSVKQPVAAIGNKALNVRTNQLPTIGGGKDDSVAEVATGPETDVDAPAIERFAIAFENPEGRPLMAILLLVDPGEVSDGATVAALPFPVSYVVDASSAGAGDEMRRYRAAGSEVVLLAPLPARASPVDVEVAFQSYLTSVPQAVAVMDSTDAAFQSGRQVATQVAEALAASGHGMITYSRGMNSAMQVAERENVPSAVVFREFDKNGQNASAIKRFLDQAAFRAGQQTGVILVGHNRPETITALLEWGLGNRASTVALAPVSAVLLAQ